VYAVRPGGEGKVNVVVYEEEGPVLPAELLEAPGDGELQALLAGLVAKLQQAGAAFEGQPGDAGLVPAPGDFGVDDDVEAAQTGVGL